MYTWRNVWNKNNRNRLFPNVKRCQKCTVSKKIACRFLRKVSPRKTSRLSARKRLVRDGFTRRDRTIHVVCTGWGREDQKCSVVIASGPLKNKHPPILCTYTTLWAINRRCPAQIVCSSNPFSPIPWNSTRIITASVPANYVFAEPYERATVTCMYTRSPHVVSKQSALLSVYGYCCSDSTKPTSQHSAGCTARNRSLLCAPDRE